MFKQVFVGGQKISKYYVCSKRLTQKNLWTKTSKFEIDLTWTALLQNKGLKKEQFSEETSIADIIKDSYTGEQIKNIQEDVQFMEKNRIYTLKHWKSLKPEKKSIFPVFLAEKLDNLTSIFVFTEV